MFSFPRVDEKQLWHNIEVFLIKKIFSIFDKRFWVTIWVKLLIWHLLPSAVVVASSTHIATNDRIL